MAAVAIVLWAVVPGVVAGRMRQAIVDGNAPQALPLSANAAELENVVPLAASYLTRLIIGDALLEGAAFFNLVAYLIEQQVFSLAVAGALLLIILAQFPSLSRLTDWVERELATTEQLQVLRRS
jgi:hypothetical protein